MKDMSLDYYVIFEKIQYLLQALYTTRRNETFPLKVKEINQKNGGWAVSLQQFGNNISRSLFERLCSQYGWRATVVERLPSTHEVQLAEIIDREWHYCDPLRLDQTELSRSYILGAQNSQQAQYLLKYLTGCHTENISARPLIVPENDVSNTGFPFLWEITVTEDTPTHPPLFLLQEAQRTWWRTVELYHEQIKIFVEWPYQLPEDYLRHLDWGKDARLVLISRHESPIVVRISNDDPTFYELIDVAEVQVGKRHTISVNPAPVGNLNFKVDLKLVQNPSPRQIYADRISELTVEIEAKQALKELLQDQSEDIDTSDIVPEPLFLYAGKKSNIPFELRRLLIEWSDQEQALRSLQYQKIDWQSLPQGIMPTNTDDVHVLTTETALKKGVLNSVGLQLRDYTPAGGARFTRFDLLTEWMDFGLRIFIPQDRQLELYPALKPSPVAADKLKRALLPPDANKQDWIVVLIPADNGQLQVCQLPAKFKPLIEEFNWQCNLDIPISSPSILRPLAQKARGQFITSIEKLFTTNVKGQIKTRLKKAKGKLVARLELVSHVLTKREENVSSCEKELSEIDNQFVEIYKVLNRLDSELNDLVTNLSNISQDTAQIQDKLENLKSIANQIDEKVNKISALNAEARRLRLQRLSTVKAHKDNE